MGAVDAGWRGHCAWWSLVKSGQVGSPLHAFGPTHRPLGCMHATCQLRLTLWWSTDPRLYTDKPRSSAGFDGIVLYSSLQSFPPCSCLYKQLKNSLARSRCVVYQTKVDVDGYILRFLYSNAWALSEDFVTSPQVIESAGGYFYPPPHNWSQSCTFCSKRAKTSFTIRHSLGPIALRAFEKMWNSRSYL